MTLDGEVCICGHPFRLHKTPGTECVGFIGDTDTYCYCGWFRQGVRARQEARDRKPDKQSYRAREE